MRNMVTNKKIKMSGMSIPELIIVIIVLAILAAIVFVSYNGWRQSVAITQLKSDLNGAAAAMENSRTFNNLYPSSIPSTFTHSDGVTLSASINAGGTTYCIDANNDQFPDIYYRIDPTISGTGAVAGRCTTINLSATVASSSEIDLSWNSISGATSYTLQRDTNSSFSSAVTVATQSTTTFASTGLSAATTYYYRVLSTSGGIDSSWSTPASATTNFLAPTTPSAPVVSMSTSGPTTTWTWPTTSCVAGSTLRYQYDYTIPNAGYDSGWTTVTSMSVSFTTSTVGNSYTVSVQAQCYNSQQASSWSASGSAVYYRLKDSNQVAIGYTSVCGIATLDSQAYCAGYNWYGELGNNTTNSSSIMTPIFTGSGLGGKTIKSISSGGYSSCVIASDNHVYCWGQNGGRLGNGSNTNSIVPVAVNTSGVLSGKTIKTVAVGYNHACVIASDGQVYCWGGYNNMSVLGNNTFATSLVPVAVDTSGVLSGKTVVAIAVGDYHTCVIASDGQVYCWGYNYYGELGNNSTTNSVVPVAVNTSGVLGGKTISSIAAGGEDTCVIASDGQAYCWGDNSYGVLGNNSNTLSTVPVAVNNSGVLSGKTIASVVTSRRTSCAIASDGQAYCWGSGSSLGNNTNTSSKVPVAVNTSGVLNNKTVSTISTLGSEGGRVCVFANNNHLYCWGDNSGGSLGQKTCSLFMGSWSWGAEDGGSELVPVATGYPFNLGSGTCP